MRGARTTNPRYRCLQRLCYNFLVPQRGEMAERTKAPVSKTGMGASSSWVRIPLSPPISPIPSLPTLSPKSHLVLIRLL